MKRIFLLVGLFLLPFFVFAQEVSISGQNSIASLYTVDTARKFTKVKKIVKGAKRCLQLPRHKGPLKSEYGCVYDIEEVKSRLNSENLNTFLRDKNNRIVLAAVANYITDTSRGVYYDNYELFITLGIDPVEAAIRVGDEESLQKGIIYYSHWEFSTSFGVSVANESIEEIPVQITKQEIENIKTQLENEKPLVDNFNKEMRKFRKQIRREDRKALLNDFNNAMQQLENKLEKIIKPSDTWMRWVTSMSRKS